LDFVRVESAGLMKAAMPTNPPDFEAYFAKAGAGKTIARFKKNDIIYSQGDPAETIFYIQKGRVRAFNKL
jgi:CRP-like cAMP-binding protein